VVLQRLKSGKWAENGPFGVLLVAFSVYLCARVLTTYVVGLYYIDQRLEAGTALGGWGLEALLQVYFAG
jgi:hypothetical protein